MGIKSENILMHDCTHSINKIEQGPDIETMHNQGNYAENHFWKACARSNVSHVHCIYAT